MTCIELHLLSDSPALQKSVNYTLNGLTFFFKFQIHSVHYVIIDLEQEKDKERQYQYSLGIWEKLRGSTVVVFNASGGEANTCNLPGGMWTYGMIYRVRRMTQRAGCAQVEGGASVYDVLPSRLGWFIVEGKS